MALLGLVAVAALGSACVHAQPLYCSRWLDITTCQSPSGTGRHELTQTGETPDLRHATSLGRDAQATPCVRSWREARWRSLGPSSIPSLGDGVMLGTAWIDRPVRGAALRFHVPSVQHGSAAMPVPSATGDQASALAP
jgi:hypothetical protein